MMAKGPRTETGLSCHISAFVAHIHTQTRAQARRCCCRRGEVRGADCTYNIILPDSLTPMKTFWFYVKRNVPHVFRFHFLSLWIHPSLLFVGRLYT